MWHQRNNVTFRNYTCNPNSIIEQAISIYHRAMLFSKQNNMFMHENDIGASKNTWNKWTVK